MLKQEQIDSGGAPITIFYRPESTDYDAIQEVNVKKAYRKLREGFDVYPGERWLDLGANVGAFAIYCRLKLATAVCYEPDKE